MLEDIFNFYTFNEQKLIEYGFKQEDNNYSYETSILNGQFKLFVLVDSNSKVSTKLIDAETDERYILHLIENNEGEFIGKIRSEIEIVLQDIKQKCFDKQIYKGEQTKQIINYINKKFATNVEFLWENKLPTYSIMRCSKNKKWYGILFTMPKNKLGLPSNEVCEFLNLKYKNNTDIINNKTIFEGYHSNKKNWITILLNSDLDINLIFGYIDNSYNLTLKTK